MSEINGVGGRNKYVEISGEATYAPGEIGKADPKPIETRDSTMVIYGHEKKLDEAVGDAARFAGVKTTTSAPVTRGFFSWG